MYTFKIKDNTPDINVLVSRCLLVLGAMGALVFRSNQPFFINILTAIILFSGAMVSNILIIKFKWNRSLPLLIGAFILLIATHSLLISAILLLFELIIHKLYRQPLVIVNTEGVEIKKMLSINLHTWVEFNNIILKDDLLTLDFKDNKLWQLTIMEGGNEVDEGSFNTFCSRFIGE